MEGVVKSVPSWQPSGSSATLCMMLPNISSTRLARLQYLAWLNGQQLQSCTECVGGSWGDVWGIKTLPVTGSSCIFSEIMAFTLQTFIILRRNKWKRAGYEGEGRAEEIIKRSSEIKNSQGTVSPSNFPELSTPAGGCGFWKVSRIKPVAALKGQNLLFLKYPGSLEVWWETAPLDLNTFS